MKRTIIGIIISMLVVALFCFFLTGLDTIVSKSQRKSYNKEVVQLKERIKELHEEIRYLEEKKTSLKAENSIEEYIITVEIRQKHYTLDFTEHIKDKINAIEIDIPVTKEFYDSVNVGDVLNDTFRMGSFIVHGSVGKWEITIINKEVR